MFKKLNFKKWKINYIPSAFSIIILLMLVFIFVSWIGKATNSTTTVDGKIVNIQGLGILDVFTGIWSGFKAKAEIILFILSIGGLLGIIARTKAIDIGIEKLILKLKGKEILLIPILMFLFGLGGTTYGMWEETIAFFPILIPIFIKMGYGPFPAVLTVLLGAGTGVIASTVNPFAVLVAFDGAGAVLGEEGAKTVVPQSTMLGSRWISFVIFELIAIPFVLFVSTRIKNGKIKVHDLNMKKINEKFQSKHSDVDFNWKRKLTLVIFMLSFLFMILSFLPWSTKEWLGEADDPTSQLGKANASWEKNGFWLASQAGGWAHWGWWYFISIASMFLITSIIIFIINRNDFIEKEENKEKVFINTYVDGAKDVLSVSLLIAVASGLGVLLKASHVGPWMANSMSGIGKGGLVGFGILMFIVAMILSFIIPSTTGFAAAFMPIFGGVAAIAFPGKVDAAIGVTVMSFIFASGIVNLITPTSAVLMAYTSYAEVPYKTWIKQVWPIIITFIIVSIIVISIFASIASGGSTF